MREEIKGRKDKAQVSQSGRLAGRRENRELEELQATVQALQKEVDDKNAQLAAAGASKGKGSTEKTEKKEMAEWTKKIRRLETERDKAIEERDDLTKQLKALQASLDSNAALTETKSALSSAQSQVGELSAKLKVVQEECEVFRTRVQQLEQGAASTAEITSAREKKEFGEKMAKMEDKVLRLEADKVNLFGQLKAAKAKQDALEQQKTALDRDKTRLETEVRDAKAQANKARKAGIGAGAGAGANDSGASVEEKKRLEDKVAELQKLVASYSDKIVKLEAGDEAKPDLTWQLGRYHDLLANLRLSEDEVTTLLEEGSDWPPVRGDVRMGLVDLFWLLDDQKTELDDEKAVHRAKVAELQEQVKREKKRADAAEAEASAAAAANGERGRRMSMEGYGGARTPPDSRESSRTRATAGERDQLRRELEAVKEQKEKERERLQETIVQLENRVAAFEANDRAPSRSSGFAPTSSVSSGQAQALIKRLSKSVTELNEQVSELRTENMDLLLKLVGVE
ncbi:hypothetical protein JCM8097_003364 [Rhodosporidiobolus ruineniae]